MTDKEREAEHERAMRVVEKYFDVDITTADDAYDVLLDNDIEPSVAHGIAVDMYPIGPVEDGG